MTIRIRAYIDLDYIGAGSGPALMGQSQANNPGAGQGLGPSTVGAAQTMRIQVSEAVVPGGASPTLAQIDTTLKAIADDVAGSTGTPLINATVLAQLQAWATGGG
jgi:hypothetical protein